jgi:MerR family transcriptional regulator, heat shock protein HspR
MAESKFFLVRVSSTSGVSSYLTLSEVAYHCGLHPELVERLVRLGLIDSQERQADGEVLFQADVIPLIRTILRLRNELGVNYAGIGVVLELMARIDTLEDHVRELEGRILGRG